MDKKKVIHYTREALISYLRTNHITGEEAEVLKEVVAELHDQLRSLEPVADQEKLELVETSDTPASGKLPRPTVRNKGSK